jgi:hypothetical protein
MEQITEVVPLLSEFIAKRNVFRDFCNIMSHRFKREDLINNKEYINLRHRYRNNLEEIGKRIIALVEKHFSEYKELVDYYLLVYANLTINRRKFMGFCRSYDYLAAFDKGWDEFSQYSEFISDGALVRREQKRFAWFFGLAALRKSIGEEEWQKRILLIN